MQNNPNEAPESLEPVNTPPVNPEPEASPQAFETSVQDSITYEPVVAESQPSKKPKKGLVIGAIIAAVLVVLAGGAAFAYTNIYQNPDKVVTDALVNVLNARTATATGSLSVQSDDYEATIAIDGKAHETAGEVAVTISYTADGNTVNIKGAGHFSAEGDLFVKVENAREIIEPLIGEMGETTAFDALFEKVDGNWIKIAADDLGTVNEEYERAQVCFEELAADIKNDNSLSREVADLYSANKFIVINESLGSRDIKGVGSLGYVVDIDEAKTKGFISGLGATKIGEKIRSCDDQVDFNEMAESIEAETSETASGRVEVWVSRFGHEFTEVNAAGTSDGVQVELLLNPVFNKEVNIEAPANALTFEEIQTDIQNAFIEYYMSQYPGLTGDTSAPITFEN